MPRRTQLNRIARKADQRQKALAQVQLELAAATRPEDGPQLVEPAWHWRNTLMAKRADKLASQRGVAGYGLGFRQQAHVPTDEPALTVFVTRKLTPNQLRGYKRKPLPRFLGTGKRRLRVDVVELGDLEYLSLGESVGPRNPRGIATLGAVAIDNITGGPMAITAQHMTGLKQIPQNQVRSMQVFAPAFDQVGSRLYGDVIQGSMLGIDACKIKPLDPRNVESRIPFIGEVRGVRPMRVPGDRNLPVRMFGSVSGLQAGVILNPLVALPKFGLDAAIIVQMFGQRGDSGAALVDPHNIVLGTLVGQVRPGVLIFCVMNETLARLGCDIPTVGN